MACGGSHFSAKRLDMSGLVDISIRLYICRKLSTVIADPSIESSSWPARERRCLCGEPSPLAMQ